MSKLDKILHYFPETELPIIVSEDYLSDYETNADPFPQVFIDEVLLEWEKDADEFTEFIPCFRLPKEEKFNTVVYWKGALLRYDFIMVTLDKNGELINKKSIASTIVNDNVIKKSVASIEPDLIINIIAGQTLDGEEYDASMSKAFAMEVLPTGEIIFALDTLN
ncbi:MAG TPA: hypothetical protein VK169_18905 [Saprospiraceae bacterium]|jgi:hypothetical protein|nr:hypothetical protein [Saprospiraceae bacterium]